MLFLCSVAALLLTMYLFLFEHRYIYPFLAAVILPFVAVVSELSRPGHRMLALGYAATVVAVAALLIRDAHS